MAIKIPSKYIFNPIEHSLVKKNKIDKVNVSATIIHTDYEKDSILYSKDVWDSDQTSVVGNYTNLTSGNYTTTQSFDGAFEYTTAGGYGEISNTILLRYTRANIVIEIPKEQASGTIAETDSVDYTLQYKRLHYNVRGGYDDTGVPHMKLEPILSDEETAIPNVKYIDYDIYNIYDDSSLSYIKTIIDIVKINKEYEKDSDDRDKVYSGKLQDETVRQSQFTVPVWVNREWNSIYGHGHPVASDTKSGTNVVTVQFIPNGTGDEISKFSVTSNLDFTANLGNSIYPLSTAPTHTYSLASNRSVTYDGTKDAYIIKLTNIPVAYDWCVMSHIINGYGMYFEGNKGSSNETNIGRLCCKDEDTGEQLNRELTSYGEEIEPFSLVVDIKGEKYTIDLSTANISIGSGNNVTSVENNELLQRNNYTSDTDDGSTVNLIRKGYQKVIDKYKNGKETLKLKLAVGEYYDTDGNLAISTKDSTLKMLFEIGDEVIPYKNSAYGTDIPISTDKDGNIKSFIVVGTEITYGGVLYQEITLQEKVS